jgi:hypothetical protein
MRDRILILCIGVLIGSLIAAPVFAQVLVSWDKDDVVPVVLVKPVIGGFAPVEGSSIGNTWRKDEVRPVVLLKPAIGGFAPREGTSIGNIWSKDEVRPMILVKPQVGRFVPSGSTSEDF